MFHCSSVGGWRAAALSRFAFPSWFVSVTEAAAERLPARLRGRSSLALQRRGDMPRLSSAPVNEALCGVSGHSLPPKPQASRRSSSLDSRLPPILLCFTHPPLTVGFHTFGSNLSVQLLEKLYNVLYIIQLLPTFNLFFLCSNSYR